jgi:hypothetical protein
MDRTLSLSDVSAAVRGITTAISSIDDANTFLANPDPDKSNATRFVSWIVVLRLGSPSPSSWPSDLFGFYHSYQLLLAKLTNPSEPLRCIPSEAEARTIASDVSRGMSWFTKHAEDLGLSGGLTADAEERVVRVLVLLSLTFSEFRYTQSYDRYAFITYLLALDFCGQGGLPPDFAEAMCFPLAREWLSIRRVSHFLERPAATELHFNEMDDALMSFAPKLMGPLRRAGHGSIHFAFRWELLLFADEHDVKPLLLIWDHILLHRSDFKRYMRALCLAHVKQIARHGRREITMERVQTYRGWDVQRIIKDANIIAAQQASSFWDSMHVIVILLAGLLLLMFFWRSRLPD